MNGFNLGDIFYQFSTLISLILFIVLIVWLFRSLSKRNKRLDSIEKKLDDINNKLNRNID